MQIRQSDLKTWNKCPLQYKYRNLDLLPRLQGGSASFGTIVHECVLWMEVNRDCETAVRRFEWYWEDPTRLDPELRIDYYERGRNYRKFKERGPELLRNWWKIIQWDTALVLGREFTFDVPIGDGHVLHGTIDKLEIIFDAKNNTWVVRISDYKTNAKVPTYEYLGEDLQFSAYAYATTRVEFWIQLAAHLGVSEQRGIELFEQYRDLPRYGEWVSLVQPKRMDAGVRTQRHYNRLIMAVNALADSVAMRIFVPNISGESCRYCEFRQQCGLPELDEDGNPVSA